MLVSALGYLTTPTEMAERLGAILSDADYMTLVARKGGQVVGFVGSRIGPLYESRGYYGQIMALAVAAEHQRRGIGSMLLHAAESALVERGACVLVVNSGSHRGAAHAFYECNGYNFTARRYKKVVGTPLTAGVELG
jgi:ribosomal protein S18 acetylase RimI-like enzyme